MSNFTYFITKYRKSVIITFLTLAIISFILIPMIKVNYKLEDYLPKNAQSTNAIKIMKKEFGGDFPNARVMITNVTIKEALDYKEKLAATKGITSVNWLDDVIGLDILTTTPTEFLDTSIVKNYYKNNNAIISITIESGMEESTVNSIYSIIGDTNAIEGDAVNTAASQEMSSTEVTKAMAILLPVIIIILILTTTSWFEPILFLLSIGIAVVINMGLNVFLGQISFVTQAISPILQLAVSLDYAIFLLHTFNEYREQHDPEDAMRMAMKKSLSAIAASAATTVVGFLALIFMRFSIGADLGINLVKGVVLSFVSVMTFLPAITLVCYKLIDKTKHRKFIPSVQGASKWLIKIRIVFLIPVLLIVIPCFLAQSKIEFKYGMDSISNASRVSIDRASIEKQFSKENQLVLLVPKENSGKETELCDELSEVGHITSVVSYVTAVGAEIPPEYLSEQIVDQFYSKNYSRIILYTDMKEEGPEAFKTVKTVLNKASNYYNQYYLAGQSATLYDMKTTVSSDTKLINLIAIIGIIVVLLITFKSLSLPLILIFTIETAIWINLSFAYFSDLSFNFIGYLVISTVQLGSTVDYAILLTDRYLTTRKELSKIEAIKTSLGNNLIAIVTSATILATAGITLALTSSNPIVAQLGTLLGRGTLLSFIMVVCVLPALLILFDKLIYKTTLNSGFHITKKHS